MSFLLWQRGGAFTLPDLVNQPSYPNVILPPTGSSDDILARIKLILPKRWFAYDAPLRDAILGGVCDGAAWCYSLITYARLQTRLATATGPWLDILANDYLGTYLQRNGLTDGAFRAVIRSTILQERVTRAGMVNALTNLTGATPFVFEPWNTGDTGAYNRYNFAYGKSGGWGSMQLPGQVFLRVRRTSGSGVANVGGYGSYAGGYGVGSIEYVGGEVEQTGITDAIIYQVIETTKPTGVTVWTQID